MCDCEQLRQEIQALNAKIDQLTMLLNQRMKRLEDNKLNTSIYMRKDELISECGKQRNGVVTAIVPADTWPPIVVDLDGKIIVTE